MASKTHFTVDSLSDASKNTPSERTKSNVISYPPPEAIPDWSNLQVLHRNTLPPRASFNIWPSEHLAIKALADKIARIDAYGGGKHSLDHPGSGHSLCGARDGDDYVTYTPYTESLSGTWAFKLEAYPAPLSAVDVSKWGEDGEWDKIHVPGMWQLQFRTKDCQGGKEGERWGKPQYTNVNYPWPVDVHDVVARVPVDDNPTGCYTREFEVPKEWLEEKREGKGQVRLRFEGVDSGFHVWINEKLMGYGQGARNPTEFHITSFLKENGEKNTVCVRVYQRCEGSYLEDQDQWWLSGIFRDLTLNYFPLVHVNDFKIETRLVNDYQDAQLFVRIELNEPATVQIKLMHDDVDTGGAATKTIKSMTQSSDLTTVFFEMPVEKPHLWSAEDPDLYTLFIVVGNDPDASPVVASYVGFRQVEIQEGLLKVNGRPILIRGVNRHEHHPHHGRAVPYSTMLHDLLLMKNHGINAIRTSHYPNDPRMYDVADVLGLYVLDEADLECHGMGELGAPYQERTSDNEAWEEAYVLRIQQMVNRDKNHACVIMWSLGNESFYGRNLRSMYRWVKAIDGTRPVHYEPDWGCDVSDVVSRMYWSVDDCVNHLEHPDREIEKREGRAKPLILCEYAHAMGNGPGGVKEYIEAMYKYPSFQGGFIWEWANHGLVNATALISSSGEPETIPYYAYGGDFGDTPNDGHFVMDGLCFSDHTATPGLLTYGKCIQPVEIQEDAEWDDTGCRFFVTNRYDFLTLNHLRCLTKLVAENDETGGLGRDTESEYEVPHLGPGERGEINSKVLMEEVMKRVAEMGEIVLEIRFVLRERTLWAEKGKEVAWGQVKIQQPQALEALIKGVPKNDIPPLLTQAGKMAIIETEQCHCKFDAQLGHLVSWRMRRNDEDRSDCEETVEGDRWSMNLLDPEHPPLLSFYRALTDNDKPQDGQDWVNSRLNEVKHHLVSFHAEVCDDDADASAHEPEVMTIPSYSAEYFADELPATKRTTPPSTTPCTNTEQSASIPSHSVSYFAHEIPASSTSNKEKSTKVVKVTTHSRYAPPVFEWSIDTVNIYVFRATSVEISVTGHPRGLKLPPTIARIGLSFHLFGGAPSGTTPGELEGHHHLKKWAAKYWGRGPGEGYRDTLGGGRMGVWKLDPSLELGPEELGGNSKTPSASFCAKRSKEGEKETRIKEDIGKGMTGYEWPQENGNRTDVRWVELMDEERGCGVKASFGERDGCSFSAGRYSIEDLDMAEHAYGLRGKRQDGVVVRLDWEHHGIGSGSCGPRATELYRLNTGDFKGRVLLECLSAKERA